ncbi:putative DNA-binding transcriptional regulator YafY [Flavobacterium sp. 270]|uniref:helix-turn-helix transcriptional regulator n=1 Tax=Flavobacterium sp. 270 TaxID=2512114 RepID=UPI0010665E9B|nr:WYL domain-containing protein [Flavobacterium sp. 270]TDW52735.1 putative DNA-binding transcriptional regulator YafY [Flavobacterium sp. 270]
MAKVGFYKRYLYIVEKLTSVPSSFQEIHKYVMTKLESDDLGGKFEYSNRTFDRDKTDIYDLFGILIQYDRKDKVYYIEDRIENASVSRMIESFSIHQALKGGNKITPSVYLECRKSSGTHLLNGILYAIQNYYMVSFTHTKFWDMEITQRTVKPIAIKEAQHRWYLIAVDTKNGEVRNFGFDRITDFRILETKFKQVNCNVDKIYRHSFGIEKYEPAQKLLLEFSWQQGNYIKSFPLHASQKVVSDTEKGLLIELFIHPTNEVVMELLKYGAEVKVLEPIALQNTLRKRISEMMKKYQ